MVENRNRKIVIACRMMEFEIQHANRGGNEAEILYIDEKLHRVPSKLKDIIQEHIRRHESPNVDIVLGYGRCSGGTVGLSAKKGRLILPKTAISRRTMRGFLEKHTLKSMQACVFFSDC